MFWEVITMAKQTAQGRKQTRSSNFVYPRTRDYPIHDKAHARAALRLGAQKRTKGDPATIRRRVYAKYPSLKPNAGKRKR